MLHFAFNLTCLHQKQAAPCGHKDLLCSTKQAGWPTLILSIPYCSYPY